MGFRRLMAAGLLAAGHLALAASLLALAVGALAAQSEGPLAAQVAPAPTAQVAPAQAPAAQAATGTPAAPPVPDFYFRLDANGKPLFTQVLHWEADPGAFEYEVILRDASGSKILDRRVKESRAEVHLAPGLYSFKIVTFNLLDKAEAETPWHSLTILKAEQPLISSVSPKTIFLDTLDWRVTIVGSRLLDMGKIILISEKGTTYPGNVEARKGESEVVVTFPAEAYQPGRYALCAENPGGLSTTIEGALRVGLQSPMDLLASAGYSPFVALADPWFVETWSANFHPQSFNARIEFLFIKLRRVSFGLGLGMDERRMSGTFGGAKLTSDFVLAGADLVNAYRLSRRLQGIIRLGGGLSWSHHVFDYQGYAGPTTTSYDPFARTGFELQWLIASKMYAEIGAEGSCLFLLDHYAFGISPSLRIGYRLF